jgi:hypothetical protein
MAEKKPRFHLWCELLPEMQGEIAARLDPFSKQVLAMGNKSLWVRFGNPNGRSWFSSGYNVARLAHPNYIKKAWRLDCRVGIMGRIRTFGKGFGEWVEGFAVRGDKALFQRYFTAAYKYAKARAHLVDLCPELWVTVYSGNCLTLLEWTREGYPEVDTAIRPDLKLTGALRAQYTQPNIDFILALGIGREEEFFYGVLLDACLDCNKGTVLVACAARLRGLAVWVAGECGRFCALDSWDPFEDWQWADSLVLEDLCFWRDIRPIYVFSTRARAIFKRSLERVLAAPLEQREAHVYRDLKPILQDLLLPELVHYTDWAFVEDTLL